MTHEGMVPLERKPGCSQGQREPAGSPQPSAVLTGRRVTGTQLPKTKGPSDLDRPQSYWRGIVQRPRTPAALGPGPESAPTCPGRGGRCRERKRKARRERGKRDRGGHRQPRSPRAGSGRPAAVIRQLGRDPSVSGQDTEGPRGQVPQQSSDLNRSV